MKLNQLLTNKKNIILLIIVLIVISIGAVFLIKKSVQDGGNKDGDTKIEQNEEDGNTELEVVEPDVTLPETTTDVSGDWEGTSGSKKPTNSENNPTSKDENVLKDDIEWGNIY